jgi:hypothetical protein
MAQRDPEDLVERLEDLACDAHVAESVAEATDWIAEV